MRRSLFVVVWLSLVLSLLKGSAAEEPAPDGPTVTLSTKPPDVSARTSAREEETQTPKPPETTSSSSAAAEETQTTKPPETTSSSSAATEETQTTKPPETTSSSSAATEETQTTKPPETTSSSSAATEETQTTKPPETTSSSSAATEETQTTKPPETTSSSSAATEETPTTKPPESSATTSSSTTVSSTTKPTGDFCSDYPCGRSLATCISLKNTYTCECPYGFYYREENCHGGKVYPAIFFVRASYSDNLQIVNSTEYEEVFKKISEFFTTAFKSLDGYVQTVIVEIRPQKESRNSAQLNVTVTNLFTLDSGADEASVNSAVQRAITNGENPSYVYSYKVAKPCDAYRCDTQTTECRERDTSPECVCKPYLAKTEWDDRSCSACSNSCSAEAHRYCVRTESGPTCKCMINFKEKDGKCVACAVGYSGEECKDNSELILIIVGTVLGAVILILVIAISIISVRAKRQQNPEKRSLMKPEYENTNRSDDRPSMFPRVKTTSGHANPGYQSNNPYEMRSTNKDRFPERDYDDLYEISREPRGFRMQRRY